MSMNVQQAGPRMQPAMAPACSHSAHGAGPEPGMQRSGFDEIPAKQRQFMAQAFEHLRATVPGFNMRLPEGFAPSSMLGKEMPDFDFGAVGGGGGLTVGQAIGGVGELSPPPMKSAA